MRSKSRIAILLLCTLFVSLISTTVFADDSVDPSTPAGFWAEDLVPVYNIGDNGAYVSGSRVTRKRGMSNEFAGCRGMTWVVHKQSVGYTLAGADGRTNPYRGDTPCDTVLPVMCLRPDATLNVPANRAYRWVGGELAATLPVAGTALTSAAAANNLCQAQLGWGYRMATFHEIGSSWGYWGTGTLPTGTRLWVHIEDQLGNPWNSADYTTAQPQPMANTAEVRNSSDNPAYAGYRNTAMPANAPAPARTQCKGMTWTVLHQFDNLTHVGADAQTDAFIGDTPCWTVLPVLCIRPNNYPSPSVPNYNIAPKWTGAEARLTVPMLGYLMNTRDAANTICSNSFGAGWRMAQFHDGGILGSQAGWDFWAYGSLQTNTRFWVSNGSQPANTYD